MGTVPTWTCAPYQTELRPSFGQQIAWGESNAIVFANSVIGARTERYPDLFDICCAITGRAPAIGLHLSENRAGQLLFRLVDIPDSLQRRDDFYPVLGNFVGKASLDKIPVIDGISVKPDDDQLKALVPVVERLAEDFRSFAPEMIADPKVSLLRPYRDTRFSDDKTPLKALASQVRGWRDTATGLGDVTAMAFGASSEDLARTCHAHPTLPEVVKEAALAVDGRAIHF